MTWETYEKAFIREFPKGSRAERKKRGIRLTLPCNMGPKSHEVTVEMTNRIPPPGLRHNLTKNGWIFQKNKAFCPDCQNRIAESKTHEEEMNGKLSLNQKPPQNVDIRKARREAFQYIQEFFDIETGRYTDKGMSDQSIAQATGLSEKAVGEIRERDFGSLNQRPGEIDTLFNDIASLRQQIVTATRRAEETVSGTFRSSIERLDDLQSRLDKVCRDNNWT